MSEKPIMPPGSAIAGEARYNDVAAALPGTSSSTLAETLHALETARLIDKGVASIDRPHATYLLMPSGEKLLSRLRQLLTDVDTS